MKQTNKEQKKEDSMFDETFLGLTILDLMGLKSKADNISGNWNGKTEKGEDLAQLMNEISNKCTELIKLLEEVDFY